MTEEKSILETMNRSEKRKFEKLSREEQATMIVTDIKEKIMRTANKEISDSFYKGFATGYELLYDNYVKPMMETKSEDEWQDLLIKLMSEITVSAKKTKGEKE